MTDWPKHEDGSNKRVGDMTPDEKNAVMAEAKRRFLKPTYSSSYYAGQTDMWCTECDHTESDPIFLDVERCSLCGELLEGY